MYITYDTKQYPIFADGDIALYGDQNTSKLEALERSNERPPPGIRRLMALPCNNKKPFVLPPRLVRVSDMAIVPGIEASKHGYCAFSYAWNWSGDIVVRGKENSIRVDKGKHQIIFHRQPSSTLEQQDQKKYSSSDSTTPITTMDTDVDSQRQQQQEEEGGNRYITASFVKFEQVIQQICQEFNIQYVWYDQLCINNKNSKYNSSNGVGDTNHDVEMRQMHQYYYNAQYTVVLIPEMKIIGMPPSPNDSTYYPVGHHNISRCIRAIYESQWSMRALTYQEAMSSKRLLFLGQNTYFWSDSMRQIYYSQFAIATASTRIAAYYVKSLCDRQQLQENSTTQAASITVPASVVLRHFHTRRSTKEHDRLFALANVFHNIDSYVTSKAPVLEQLVDLYSKIANQDLTILCFGKATNQAFNVMQRSYPDLPSWTGINGYHIYSKVNNTVFLVKNHGDVTQRKYFWSTTTTKSSNNSNNKGSNIDITVHLQKIVRKVVITLAFANKKAKTAPSTTGLMMDIDEPILMGTKRSSYTVCDGIMYMDCKCMHVLIEPFDWDGRFGRFSADQVFSYQTTSTSANKSYNKTFSSGTRLWMDSKDLMVLKEATGLEVTHTLLLNSLVSETCPSSTTHNESIVSSICFSLTTVEQSPECIILSGVSFDVQHCSKRFKAYPVIQQDSDDTDNYKSIGTCFVRSTFKHFSNFGSMQKFKIK